MTAVTGVTATNVVISIHIPRVGDDMLIYSPYPNHHGFQSTSPVWGMTDAFPMLHFHKGISIHIPRVGDDLAGRSLYGTREPISIHIPRVGDDR